MIEQFRRVVPGYDESGATVSTKYTEVVPPTTSQLFPGTTFWLLLGTSDGITRIGANDDPVQTPFFPGPGGTRLVAVRFAPAETAGSVVGDNMSAEDLATIQADAEDKFPGMFEILAREADNPGFHQTDTLDYAFVVDGELWVEFDNGEEQRLTPGSCVVQRGTHHAWRNRSDRPATLVYVIVGAERAG